MKPQMRVAPFKGILFFICAIVLCLVLTSVVTVVVASGPTSPARLRIATVIQDIVLFILPAIMTAMVVTRYPARLLEIDRVPPLKPTLLAIATLLAAIPAMDYIVNWNESLLLPESMAGVEQWMKQSEESAKQIVKLLMSGTSVGSLIISLLIIGVLAGLSEELFFRGTLQRLMTPSRGSAHVAVWVTAFIFSAIHLQFFGFFPRLLLGAYLGYLLVWTGSLWVPILIHVLNNSIVVLTEWLIDAGYMTARLDRLGSTTTTWDVALGSAVLVAGLIAITVRETNNSKSVSTPHNENNI